MSTSNAAPPACSAASEIQNLTKQTKSAKSVLTASSCPHLSGIDVNPPEIQKVIVGYFVKNEGTSSHYHAFCHRVFSGRLPRPNGDADHETWQSSVDLLLTDQTLSDLN